VTALIAPDEWTASADDPWPLYQRLRDEAPVYRDEANNAYLLSRHDDVYRVLVDHPTFSSIPSVILEGLEPPSSEIRMADEPRHSDLRRIVAPLFSPGAMRRLDVYLREVAREIVDAAEGGDVTEVSSALAIPLPGRVALDLVGLPQSEHGRFMELIEGRLRIVLRRSNGGAMTGGDRETLARVQAEMWEIVLPVIEERRHTPRPDAITRVAEAQDERGREDIPDSLFLNMLLELITAGFETTQHLIELLLSHLADDPALWRRLRDDRTLVPGAIEEMLRWRSPVQALGRRATKNVAFRDVTVPAGSWLTTLYGSANRDEREFPDPDTFRIDRDLKRHVAFSAGIHYCVGAPVTRNEVGALLNELLDRYGGIERAGESVPWPNTLPGRPGKLLGWQRVPVRFVRS
jgi:cytochrome P450